MQRQLVRIITFAVTAAAIAAFTPSATLAGTVHISAWAGAQCNTPNVSNNKNDVPGCAVNHALGITNTVPARWDTGAACSASARTTFTEVAPETIVFGLTGRAAGTGNCCFSNDGTHPSNFDPNCQVHPATLLPAGDPDTQGVAPSTPDDDGQGGFVETDVSISGGQLVIATKGDPNSIDDSFLKLDKRRTSGRTSLEARYRLEAKDPNTGAMIASGEVVLKWPEPQIPNGARVETSGFFSDDSFPIVPGPDASNEVMIDLAAADANVPGSTLDAVRLIPSFSADSIGPHDSVPALSEWGMVALVTLLLLGGTLLVLRKRSQAGLA